MADESLQQSGIYCIRNIVSGRVYVGSAANIKRRWRDHQSLLRSNKHHAKPLLRSWLKHGPDAFIFEILELVPIPHLIEREQVWINRLDASNPRTGFNCSPAAGSPLGFKHSAKTRTLWSAMRQGKKLGPPSAAHRRAISAARIGKPGPHAPKSDEHRAKLSAAKFGKKMIFSEKARRNIAAATANKNRSPEMKEKVRASKLKLYQSPERRAELKAAAIKRWDAYRTTLSVDNESKGMPT